MITLHFTRLFTQGTLIGLTHRDKITFPDTAHAEDWLGSIKRAHQKGKLDYRVIESEIK